MIAAAVRIALCDAGYAVDEAGDGDGANRALQDREYRMVLLDIGLPRCDGLSLLRLLRLRHDWVPVILITARDAPTDRIAGLDAGADDYLVKPFDVGELLARMRALLRRQSGNATGVMRVGDLELNPDTRKARRGGRSEVLTATEAALLQALMTRPGRVLGRRDLERQLYGSNQEVDRNAIGYLIHGVRRKLGADAIRNIRGAGWLVDLSG